MAVLLERFLLVGYVSRCSAPRNDHSIGDNGLIMHPSTTKDFGERGMQSRGVAREGSYCLGCLRPVQEQAVLSVCAEADVRTKVIKVQGKSTYGPRHIYNRNQHNKSQRVVTRRSGAPSKQGLVDRQERAPSSNLLSRDTPGKLCFWGSNGQDGVVEGGCGISGISPDIDISGSH